MDLHVRFLYATPCLKAAPDNGMHPTSDTLLVMFRQSFGAAGDAGR
jgi:hypothetical protein